VIPGAGKSHFIDNFIKPVAEELKANYFQVSNDGIREKIMENYAKEHKEATK